MRDIINNAVEEQTQHMIKDLLPPGSINGNTDLVLTNAIYFKDTWMTPFKKESTRDNEFFLLPGKAATAKFMEQKGKFNFFENERVSILELPYAHKNFSMLILLPKTSIKEVEEYLTNEDYLSWDFRSLPFNTIQIPKFRIEQTTDPIKILESFGMKRAFNDGANFSGIEKNVPLFIGGIYHKAFVDVNEEGIEAAAATGATIELRSMPEPRDFIGNRPFIFIIREKNSGSILFIGKLTNPLTTD